MNKNASFSIFIKIFPAILALSFLFLAPRVTYATSCSAFTDTYQDQGTELTPTGSEMRATTTISGNRYYCDITTDEVLANGTIDGSTQCLNNDTGCSNWVDSSAYLSRAGHNFVAIFSPDTISVVGTNPFEYIWMQLSGSTWIPGTTYVPPAELGIFPLTPNGQATDSVTTSFTGTYAFDSDNIPTKIVFHVTNVTDTEDTDYTRTIVTDLSQLFGSSDGLTCDNCPQQNVTQHYSYSISLLPQKDYSYTVDLVNASGVLYSSDEILFETGLSPDLTTIPGFLNGGLDCDNCTPLQQAPFLMQNFFPFNIIYQIKAAISTGIAEASTQTFSTVTTPLFGHDITVFDMSQAEPLINGSSSTHTITDFIKTIISASLYIAFGYMVYKSVSGVIQSMTA